MKTKVLLTILCFAGLLSALCFAGCGNSGTPSAASVSSSVEEVVVPTLDDVVSTFQSGDRAKAIEQLNQIGASGVDTHSYSHITIDAMYAYDPKSDPKYISFTSDDNYNLYILLSISSDEVANSSWLNLDSKRELQSMLSVTMNGVNDYTDSTRLNRTNSDIKAILAKGYFYFGNTAEDGIQGGADPKKYVARISVSKNDVNLENGIIAFNFSGYRIGDVDHSLDNAIVIPTSEIKVLDSVEARDAMIEAL